MVVVVVVDVVGVLVVVVGGVGSGVAVVDIVVCDRLCGAAVRVVIGVFFVVTVFIFFFIRGDCLLLRNQEGD